jgi:hypothetical protein
VTARRRGVAIAGRPDNVLDEVGFALDLNKLIIPVIVSAV